MSKEPGDGKDKPRRTLRIGWRGYLGRMQALRRLFLMGVLLAAPRLEALEEQAQGYSFEHWAVGVLTGGQEGKTPYTAEWDVSGEANRQDPGLPVSIKFIRRGNSIYLGDALRQRTITGGFAMFVGFYDVDQERGMALLREIHYLKVDPNKWNEWWGAITLEDLRALAAGIREGTLEEAQDYARPEAARLRGLSGVISINPKINKDQRRIQCSIPYRTFRRIMALEPEVEVGHAGKIFGEVPPMEIPLGARSED